MTAPVQLSPAELALKLACREAVEAAGGQVLVAGETGRCQSRISDYCNPNRGEFMPADVIRRVEALGRGRPGWPHVTRALARAQDGHFDPGAGVGGPLQLANLGQWLGAIGGDYAELVAALAAGRLAAPLAGLTLGQRGAILREVGEAVDSLAALGAALSADLEAEHSAAPVPDSS